MAKRTTGSKRIEFSISAPNANWVGVAGDFNRWNPAGLTAKKDRKGTWKATATMPSVIDGNWITDPSCSRRSVNSYGSENSVVVVR